MFINFKPLPHNADKLTLQGSKYAGIGIPTLTTLAFSHKGSTTQLVECVITVNQEKNIITTAMQGRNGTVKEYIADGDYSITVDTAISSYLANTTDSKLFKSKQEYPIKDLQDFFKYLTIPDTIGVQSDFLDLFGITHVVVKSYSVAQETHSNRQSFTIQMLSDTPFEIKIKQDATINQ